MKPILLFLMPIWLFGLSHGQETRGGGAGLYLAPTDTPERAMVSELLKGYAALTIPTPDRQLSILANQAVDQKDLRLAEAMVNNAVSRNNLCTAINERNPGPDFRDEVVLLMLRALRTDDYDPSNFGYRSDGASRYLFYVFCQPTLNRHVGHYPDTNTDFNQFGARGPRLLIAQRLEDALAKKKSGASGASGASEPSPTRTDSGVHSSQSTPNSAERTLAERVPYAVSRWWWLGGLAVLTVLFFAVRKIRSRKTPA